MSDTCPWCGADKNVLVTFDFFGNVFPPDEGWECGSAETQSDSCKLRCAEQRIAELEAERDQLRSALNLGGYDLSVCCVCGTPVICLPDGLAMCAQCVLNAKAGGEE